MTALSRDGAIKTISRTMDNLPQAEFDDDQVREFVMMVFASFGVMRKQDTWAPPPTRELLDSLEDYDFDRTLLRQQTELYINYYKSMQSPQIDWLLANLMICAEVVATAKAWKHQSWLQHGRIRWRRVAFSAILFFINWGLWLGLALVINSFLGTTVFLAWVGATIVYCFNAWRVRRRNALLLADMAAVYEATRSATLSWSVIWDVLSKTRDKGAVWDSELYRLVEICISRPKI
ncbi:hypothetical protein [Lysobacter enzymogenes]|uniref:Uncharacterized protein n=1 Tax=Lysobacter enzymogenes TaxID=69 RepID=A0AAU9AIB8_LYSEN|nr:hypothetical protein [Lysobacter enzymogenes]BAV96203.1 hypothetical protein LEN_0716 [Lysobacter enzymogenes]